ncbi:MAG: RNA polymerase sigma factor [Ktedonobacterales bacterium]|nr:RNA polymerase sigma factor [Ktedonobacterales bacterium]
MEHDELAAALATHLDRHFERFVVAYQRRIYAFALRLTGQAQDAEEVAQDTFVRAYRALAAYPTERVRTLRLQPWLYQIALNIVRNRVRPRRLVITPLDACGDGPPLEVADDAEARPEAQAEGAERRRELATLVASLPEHFRVAVVLRHVEGRTYREMAEILGEPEGTVKSHTHRGTLLLRKWLTVQPSAMGSSEVRR